MRMLMLATQVQTKLGKSSIIMGAEVDCVSSRSKKGLSGYIELKTSRTIENDRQRRTFEKFKLLKYYAQSFLIGIPTSECFILLVFKVGRKRDLRRHQL
jgi:RAT1-interacting protein